MKAFITVIGRDTVGVVAKVAALCSELNINSTDCFWSTVICPWKSAKVFLISGITELQIVQRSRRNWKT